MTKTEQLKRKVVELIHDTTYEEAWPKELNTPITLGRLLKGVVNFGENITFRDSTFNSLQEGDYICLYFDREDLELSLEVAWLLTRPDGSEATLEDQSEETIEALYQLLCIE